MRQGLCAASALLLSCGLCLLHLHLANFYLVYPHEETIPSSFHKTFPTNITSLKDLWNINITDAPVPTGLRVVMMGDSLTRFQYLDLAYFLKHGVWQWQSLNETRENATNASLYRDFSSAKNFNSSWGNFYAATKSMLTPHEECDCFRKDTRGWNPRFAERIIENRYYRDDANSLVYLQKFGTYPF